MNERETTAARSSSVKATETLFQGAQEGMPTHGLDVEFPLLWECAKNADSRERLGYTPGQGDEEAARAMHELWMARGEKAVKE